MATFEATYPPRWRFEQIRQVLKRLTRRQGERAYPGADEALDHLDALERTLLPRLPTIAEFQGGGHAYVEELGKPGGCLHCGKPPTDAAAHPGTAVLSRLAGERA